MNVLTCSSSEKTARFKHKAGSKNTWECVIPAMPTLYFAGKPDKDPLTPATHQPNIY